MYPSGYLALPVAIEYGLFLMKFDKDGSMTKYILVPEDIYEDCKMLDDETTSKKDAIGEHAAFLGGTSLKGDIFSDPDANRLYTLLYDDCYLMHSEFYKLNVLGTQILNRFGIIHQPLFGNCIVCCETVEEIIDAPEEILKGLQGLQSSHRKEVAELN